MIIIEHVLKNILNEREQYLKNKKFNNPPLAILGEHQKQCLSLCLQRPRLDVTEVE
jgi:hypothetical protein